MQFCYRWQNSTLYRQKQPLHYVKWPSHYWWAISVQRWVMGLSASNHNIALLIQNLSTGKIALDSHPPTNHASAHTHTHTHTHTIHTCCACSISIFFTFDSLIYICLIIFRHIQIYTTFKDLGSERFSSVLQVCYAHQDCIYLMKNTGKAVILWNIITI